MCVKFPLRPKICNGIGELVGSTPYLRLEHPWVPQNKELVLKLETFNPSFSVKDRTALGLVRDAFEEGRLRRGGTVIESSSGNLGKSLAMLGANMGFRVIIVVDPKVSRQNLNCFRAFGADVIVVADPDEDGSYQSARIRRVKSIVAEHPDYYWPNQYDNSSNPQYHERHTSFELRDLEFDLLVGCVSTGGHMSGIARGVKNHRPSRRALACDVEGSAIFGGQPKPYLLNGIGLAWRSGNTDLDVFDGQTRVNDRHAISMCRHLARDTGLLLGGSSGLCVFAALSALRSGACESAVAVLPDTGANYLQELYDDDWVVAKGVNLLSSAELQTALDTQEISWRDESVRVSAFR